MKLLLSSLVFLSGFRLFEFYTCPRIYKVNMTMMEITLPTLITFIIYIILYSYHYKKYDFVLRLLTKKIFLFFLITLMTITCIAFLIDPNTYAQGKGNNFHFLYTTYRFISGCGLIFCFTTLHKLITQINIENNVESNASAEKHIDILWLLYRRIFIIISFIIALSGAYGFLTRTCWGLFRTQYISDTFMWWAELGWCIVGCIGIWAYFKYVRHWQSIHNDN